jgi:hypothetical protein
MIDADLGGGLIKQRVAREGKGRSGGSRVIVAYRLRYRAVLIYGFAKNEQENVESDDLVTAKEIAAKWLAADVERIDRAIEEDELQEVEGD